MKAELMCSYDSMAGMYPDHVWGGEPRYEKARRVRCPACGRSMMAAVRYCHDGCCAFQCIPPHKKKGWWKKPKPKPVEHRHPRRV